MLLNVPLLLRLPPGRPDVIVTTVVLATQYHLFNVWSLLMQRVTGFNWHASVCLNIQNSDRKLFLAHRFLRSR